MAGGERSATVARGFAPAARGAVVTRAAMMGGGASARRPHPRCPRPRQARRAARPEIERAVRPPRTLGYRNVRAMRRRTR
ncbi:hypothetical protein AQ908_05685 [Burkholderia pseudomallei]|nr:hypothetical protein VP95_19260 [Burkholderia pseudomallei]OMR09909.1 hypothetical protein AQ718_24620 [Burkholderia pseudomallei]OMZ98505.1 hypothetical protein AQ874_05530 [Burkholderia pseudomallei]ONB84566.1 hypothetical protein AQ908_05685 [Burkholderia pseudomallei]ONC13780.1 hypothetical protein AQ913_30575 [Burkholderia pseudomallei]